MDTFTNASTKTTRALTSVDEFLQITSGCAGCLTGSLIAICERLFAFAVNRRARQNRAKDAAPGTI